MKNGAHVFSIYLMRSLRGTWHSRIAVEDDKSDPLYTLDSFHSDHWVDAYLTMKSKVALRNDYLTAEEFRSLRDWFDAHVPIDAVDNKIFLRLVNSGNRAYGFFGYCSVYDAPLVFKPLPQKSGSVPDLLSMVPF